MNNLNVWISLVSISQLIDYFLSFLDIEKPLAQSLYSTCHCLSVFLYFTIFSHAIHTVTDNPKSAPKFNQSKTIYECPQTSPVSISSLLKL